MCRVVMKFNTEILDRFGCFRVEVHYCNFLSVTTASNSWVIILIDFEILHPRAYLKIPRKFSTKIFIFIKDKLSLNIIRPLIIHCIYFRLYRWGQQIQSGILSDSYEKNSYILIIFDIFKVDWFLFFITALFKFKWWWSIVSFSLFMKN